MSELATTRLTELSQQLHHILEQASAASHKALECGNEAGAMLDEAKAICERDRLNYQEWLRDEFGRSREWAAQLIQIHEKWPQIEARLNDQMMFGFWSSATRRAIAEDRPPSENVVFDDTAPIPESAYDVPDTLVVDFQYPDEDDEPEHSVSEAIGQFFKYIVPRKLATKEDWKTFHVRVLGTAFLLGVVPDDVSMRDACSALGVSHATISKYVRDLADKTGIRSPIMKREGARAKYSQVQREKHWRRR